MIVQQALTDAYIHACEVELQAFKPGNVSVFSDGHDMTVDDFRLSAEVSAAPLTNPAYSLGEKIYYAVKATHQAVACNTNLGIILLCAPLMQASQLSDRPVDLRQALDDVLNNSTEQDADWVFRAILLASPGGLGESEQQDVHRQATVTLLQAMRIAADKDRIALLYTNCFKDIFDFAILTYNRAFVLSGDSGWAALKVYAEMLARYPDSHIERKYGKQYSEWIAEEMALLCKAMDTANKPEEVLPMLYRIDEAFKAKKINPGTTADITVATVLVVLLEQLFRQTDV
ncbi:MAG: triphosphoribosyl-dephospho-CoA synthase [Methylomonas sp.]|jgi:triphosphoribosyl-dephospho-CoA synthase|uniref:triphosphoribosyl-dephospho-CoA synthase n=1 Tax=Methylomonas sp. TaxID=418 RepID=UPI0025D93601|nr:triphosphoribosyl-dephospho-CoA synthase [Methylomonas sp.]MCK9607260.1 triphosphoribosyl-dephospho-CoA synthase [Methylomonas sp.]